MQLLAIFSLLQLMDFSTTVIAIAMGGGEQNPLVAHVMAIGAIAGLIISKLLVMALAGCCVWARKTHAVRLANVAFALIVAWNLTIIGRLAVA